MVRVTVMNGAEREAGIIAGVRRPGRGERAAVGHSSRHTPCAVAGRGGARLRQGVTAHGVCLLLCAVAGCGRERLPQGATAHGVCLLLWQTLGSPPGVGPED